MHLPSIFRKSGIIVQSTDKISIKNQFYTKNQKACSDLLSSFFFSFLKLDKKLEIHNLSELNNILYS